jgi:hypothetical protein
MIYTKINQARQLIKKSDLKKAGYNDFSKYDYYTPEQVNKLVNDACQQVRLFNKFQLLRTDLGLMAQLEVIDLESEERELFQIATEIPEIKATNMAQQLGGAVTYSERYLLMIAYDIKDNDLDFDSQKPKEEKAEKPWLDSKAYQKVVDAMNQQKPTMVGSLTFNTNEEILNYIEGKYRLKNEYKNALKELLTFNQKHES